MSKGRCTGWEVLRDTNLHILQTPVGELSWHLPLLLIIFVLILSNAIFWHSHSSYQLL